MVNYSSNMGMESVFRLVVVSLFLLTGCEKKPVPDNPVQHVNAQEVYAHNIEYIFDYPGVVQGVIDYPVIPRISGAIFKQLYKEGTEVKKDQPLYEIDKRPYIFAFAKDLRLKAGLTAGICDHHLVTAVQQQRLMRQIPQRHFFRQARLIPCGIHGNNHGFR